MVQFLLNQKKVMLDDIAPNLSVLEWLRTNMGLCGTKEGCASGDCGACTVVIAEAVSTCGAGHVLRYYTANACLMLMSSLQGKQLLTVEHVSGEELHPVQRALVECHGSQCGFCTPGFIMSLYALYMNEKVYPGRERVIEALGGNLCRCTGYRPILEAAEKAYSYPRIEALHAIDICQSLIELTENAQPSTLGEQRQSSLVVPTELASLLAYNAAEPDATMIAGGTDLSLSFTQQLVQPEKIVDISQVKELKNLEETDTDIVIGAGLPYSQFLPLLLAYYPTVKEVFIRLGSEQVRNQGTLGGSLGNASPIGDPAPLLIALGAKLVLSTSVDGVVTDRHVDVDTFFTGYRQTVLKPAEIIRSVHIPKPSDSSETFFYKISKRMEDDISAVCMALHIDVEAGNIVSAKTGFGGMAATPISAPSVEKALIGQALSQESFEQAALALANDLSPMSDVRATKEYRLQVAANLIRRAWYESSASKGATVVRVSHA